ncbi:MAG: hypothetical protein MJE77_06455 [Proteobacteria bacterium]|nr:hypothetical protein [Pseudomonadota bacterium]
MILAGRSRGSVPGASRAPIYDAPKTPRASFYHRSLGPRLVDRAIFSFRKDRDMVARVMSQAQAFGKKSTVDLMVFLDYNDQKSLDI